MRCNKKLITRPMLSLFLPLMACAGMAPSLAGAQAPPLPPNAKVYATGLEDPRGLRFGPDHHLYVAEAGTGGKNSTGKACQQVPAPVGPYTGGMTARISKIGPNGQRTTVASGFPSTVDAMGDLIGVADVVFLDDTLYAVIAGGGCSHGNPTSPTGIARVNVQTGKWVLIADIGDYLKTHPAQIENPGDFEPDGTLYSAIAVGDKILTVEPNHGQVFSVSKNGEIRQVVDISAAEGHIVPTSIAARHDDLLIGNLGLFPITPESAKILTVGRSDDQDPAPGLRARGANVLGSKAGFTTVVAVDIGPDGLLYALELSAAAGFPAAGNGKVVRVNHEGDIEDVVEGLAVPTGMTFGPDGALYVSNLGAVPAGAAPVGAGQVLRIVVAPGY